MQFPLISKTFKPQHCNPLFLLRELGASEAYCALLEFGGVSQACKSDTFVALGAYDVLRVQGQRVHGSRFIPDGKVSDALAALRPLIGSERKGGGLQMGYIGFLSYEAAGDFEDTALSPNPKVPEAFFVLPQVLLKVDVQRAEVVLLAHEDSTADMQKIEAAIHACPMDSADFKPKEPSEGFRFKSPESLDALRQVSKAQYCRNVERIKASILEGEVFQVVLSQQLAVSSSVPPQHVYEQLRRINPSAYMYYYKTPELTIIGASPEALLRVSSQDVFYQPIAGTRRRCMDAQQDKRMREELLSSEKELCEHRMLVDLGRNDIGRIARIGSVKVSKLCAIETYAHVHHMASDITAELRDTCTSLDALRAVFPAGTLTGAPKIRAMEMLCELEKTPRGIYGGAFGYIDLGGDMDFAIMIRSLLFQNEVIHLGVGAGIVSGSVARHEDKECLHKAISSLAAIELAEQNQANGCKG